MIQITERKERTSVLFQNEDGAPEEHHALTEHVAVMTPGRAMNRMAALEPQPDLRRYAAFSAAGPVGRAALCVIAAATINPSLSPEAFLHYYPEDDMTSETLEALMRSVRA